MTAKNPSNTDIISAIAGLSRDVGSIQSENHTRHAENSKRLEGIEAQVKYTNGQVRALNQWKSNVEAVEADRASRVAQSSTNPKVSPVSGWDWKTVLAILLTLATILAGVSAR